MGLRNLATISLSEAKSYGGEFPFDKVTPVSIRTSFQAHYSPVRHNWQWFAGLNEAAITRLIIAGLPVAAHTQSDEDEIEKLCYRLKCSRHIGKGSSREHCAGSLMFLWSDQSAVK